MRFCFSPSCFFFSKVCTTSFEFRQKIFVVLLAKHLKNFSNFRSSSFISVISKMYVSNLKLAFVHFNGENVRFASTYSYSLYSFFLFFRRFYLCFFAFFTTSLFLSFNLQRYFVSFFLIFFFLKKNSIFDSSFLLLNTFFIFLANKGCTPFAIFHNFFVPFVYFNFMVYVCWSYITKVFFNEFSNYVKMNRVALVYSKWSSICFSFCSLKNSGVLYEYTRASLFSSLYLRFLVRANYNIFSLAFFYKQLNLSYLWCGFFGNFFLDSAFLKLFPRIFVTQLASFMRTNYILQKNHLNYYFISNYTWSYRHFIYHFIGIFLKKGLRNKAVKVFFFLCLNLIKKNLTERTHFFLSTSLAVIQPFFRLFKTRRASKMKVTAHRIAVSRLRMAGFNVILRNARLRDERSIILRLFSELLDISKLRGVSLKEKVSTLKLFIEHKPRLLYSKAYLRKYKHSFIF